MKKFLTWILPFPILLMIFVFSPLLHAKENDPFRSYLQNTFPSCSIEHGRIELDDELAHSIQERIKRQLEQYSFSYYRVTCEKPDSSKKTIRYIFPDTHIVRTKHETLLIHISDGEVLRVEVLQFQEPPEYEPSKRWLKLFQKKSIKDIPLRAGIDIPNIAGATMTAEKITERVQFFIVLWNEVFDKSKKK